jgi:hypothetical protein
MSELNKILEKLETLYITKYKEKFNKKAKQNSLTEYEKAFGFNGDTRIGSKNFCNYLGYFMEEVYDLSENFNKINDNNKGGNDGENLTSYFECKNQHNTMKQSLAFSEILPKLTKSIEENKNFYLLILVDKNNKSRNIPLHKGYGLNKIKNVKGYNEEIHRWISGDEIYNLLFDKNGKKVKNKILKLFKKN